MQVTSETVESKISSHQTSTGNWCIFVQISEMVGLKLYHSKALRDDTQALQETGHEAGFAPKCWGEFEMEFSTEDARIPDRWKDTGYAFGYFTELVDTDAPIDVAESYALMDAMDAQGFRTADLGYYSNLGYCKKTGNLLCYDWDMEYNNPDPTYYDEGRVGTY